MATPILRHGDQIVMGFPIVSVPAINHRSPRVARLDDEAPGQDVCATQDSKVWVVRSDTNTEPEYWRYLYFANGVQQFSGTRVGNANWPSNLPNIGAGFNLDCDGSGNLYWLKFQNPFTGNYTTGSIDIQRRTPANALAVAHIDPLSPTLVPSSPASPPGLTRINQATVQGFVVQESGLLAFINYEFSNSAETVFKEVGAVMPITAALVPSPARKTSTEELVGRDNYCKPVGAIANFGVFKHIHTDGTVGTVGTLTIADGRFDSQGNIWTGGREQGGQIVRYSAASLTPSGPPWVKFCTEFNVSYSGHRILCRTTVPVTGGGYNATYESIDSSTGASLLTRTEFFFPNAPGEGLDILEELIAFNFMNGGRQGFGRGFQPTKDGAFIVPFNGLYASPWNFLDPLGKLAPDSILATRSAGRAELVSAQFVEGVLTQYFVRGKYPILSYADW